MEYIAGYLIAGLLIGLWDYYWSCKEGLLDNEPLWIVIIAQVILIFAWPLMLFKPRSK